MAKRKYRRFGSPPAVHRIAARGALRTVRTRLQWVRADLREGDCPGALLNLVDAAKAAGMAYADRRGAGKLPKSVYSLGTARTIERMRQKFRDACLKSPRR